MSAGGEGSGQTRLARHPPQRGRGNSSCGGWAGGCRWWRWRRVRGFGPVPPLYGGHAAPATSRMGQGRRSGRMQMEVVDWWRTIAGRPRRVSTLHGQPKAGDFLERHLKVSHKRGSGGVRGARYGVPTRAHPYVPAPSMPVSFLSCSLLYIHRHVCDRAAGGRCDSCSRHDVSSAHPAP